VLRRNGLIRIEVKGTKKKKKKKKRVQQKRWGGAMSLTGGRDFHRREESSLVSGSRSKQGGEGPEKAWGTKGKRGNVSSA